MAHGSTYGSSLWLARSAPDATFAPLDCDLSVDVVVVGGGIVGASAAMLFANEGRSVALLEGRTLASGATGNSTAKATIHQGTGFSRLIDAVGVEDAAAIIDGDRAALDFIRQWASKLDVPDAACPVWGWAWTATTDGQRTLAAEQDAAQRLGVETRWADAGEVPFGLAALGVAEQLLIEPAVLVRAFAERAAAHGATVCEHTRVMDVRRGELVELRTDTGACVRAAKVVLATQVPILDRTLVFAACEYRRSHVVALEADAAWERAPDMYTGIDPDGLSVRRATDEDGTPLLVVAGHGHALDVDEDGTHVPELARRARELTGAGELRRGWLTHDAFPSDGRPFVGPSRFGDDVFVATGFGGWGLARGVAAALAISGHVLRGRARWRGPMDAARLGGYVRPSTIKAGAKNAVAWAWDRIATEDASRIRQLGVGDGVVVRLGAHSVAVACDTDSRVHAVDAACTHQGCIVRHDRERGCWQCPCHGSRFDLQGSVLQGPATTPLALVDIDSGTQRASGVPAPKPAPAG